MATRRAGWFGRSRQQPGTARVSELQQRSNTSSALPSMPDRGAYMAVSSSLQQLAGGVAASAAGLIVHQASPNAPLEGYDRLGVVITVACVITLAFMHNVARLVARSAA